MSQDPDLIDTQQILDWINQAGLGHNEFDQARLPPNVTFVSNIVGTPTITVFVDGRMTSRLNFQHQIGISLNHQQFLQNMPRNEFNTRMNEFSHKLTTYDISWNWQVAPNTTQQFTTLRITKFIDSSALTRDRFYQTLVRIQIVGSQVLNELNLLLGNVQNPTEGQQDQDDNPSFIS